MLKPMVITVVFVMFSLAAFTEEDVRFAFDSGYGVC